MENVEQRLHAFEILLDTSNHISESTLEINSLRRLCSRGIPNHPPHLRPLAWLLLLGVLSKEKRRWKEEKRELRRRYYDLARRSLYDLESLQEPSSSPTLHDRHLLALSQEIDYSTTLHRFLSDSAPTSSRNPLSGSTDPSKGISSSSDPSVDSSHEGEGRKEGRSERKRKKERPEVIKNRNAVKERVVAIRKAKEEPRFTAAEKGKGRERERVAPRGPRELGTTTTTAPVTPAMLTSPAIVLSPSDDERFERRKKDIDSLSAIKTPRLALSVVTGPGSTETSPITLLSPHSIPSVDTLSASVQDRHSDCLLRLLYVFSRANPTIELTSGIAEVARTLYIVFLGGAHGEADTYWAFTGLMGELGDVVLGVEEVQSAMKRLDGRVRWADEGLWRELSKRSLRPSLPTYSYRWLTLLLSADLSSRPLIAIWDFLLSEGPTTRDSAPKVDVLLDVCTAMLLLAKRPMLAGPMAERNGTMWTAVDSLDDAAAAMFALEMLRNYPVEEVGGVSEILRVAWQVRQQRLLAESEGEGPNEIEWEEEEEPQPPSGKSRLEEVADVVRLRIAASAPSAADFSRTLQDSDAAASIAKASTNLTAAALARWKAAPTLGSLWSSSAAAPAATTPNTAPVAPTSDLSSRLAALTLPASAPGADLYRRDTSMPPSFISPRGSIVYPAGRYRRRGGDGLGIGNRLSALAEQVRAPATPSASAKPLLLSGSARAASPYAGGSTSPGHGRSPSSAHSLDVNPNLGRRVSIGRSSKPASDPSTASARLRMATADAIETTEPHDHGRVALSDPGADVPDQSGTDYQTDSTTGITKYQLTDLPVGIPDLRRHESSDSQADPTVPVKKTAGIARRQVVRKGRNARPPNLKFTDGQGLERNSSASTVESRHHSIDEGIADSLPASRTPVRADFLTAPPPPVDELPMETTPRIPRSPRMSGASPRRHAKQLDKTTAVRPTSDGALADAESNDESEGHALREQDGYGDLLESYGSLADF